MSESNADWRDQLVTDTIAALPPDAQRRAAAIRARRESGRHTVYWRLHPDQPWQSVEFTHRRMANVYALGLPVPAWLAYGHALAYPPVSAERVK